MQLHAVCDKEYPAPVEQLQGTLNEPQSWPLAQQYTGSTPMWRGAEWCVRPDHTTAAFRWFAYQVDSPQHWCYLTLRARAAGFVTHLHAELALNDPALSPRKLVRIWRNNRRVAHELSVAMQRFVSTPCVAAPAYPATAAAFGAMHASADLQRIQALDARWAAFERGKLPPLPHRTVTSLPPTNDEYDLVYAGGGLGLLHATLMAERGYRVLVFDRHEVGCAHREWNISQRELERLVATGLITWDELERDVVMARYDDGVVRFFPDGSAVPAAELHLPGVLDIALDAGALLQAMRGRFIAVGGTIWEGTAFGEVLVDEQTSGRAVVRVQRDTDELAIGTRLLIDGMGATSPLMLATHPFTGICPTVGTVVRGAAHDDSIGDILISVADTQRGRQLIWEGFPGRDGELTVYVFYYDRVGRQAQHHHSLLELFEDYFRLLPTYKTPAPEFEHLRPVYGYIPSRHSVTRPTPLPGVWALGDASAQQSPLTFCGFGSFVRNLGRTVELLDLALQRNLLAPKHLRMISAYQPNVSMNWVFSRFMSPWSRPHDVNELQNVFARVLNLLGTDVARRFFQDQMTWHDYRTIVLTTLRVYPAILGVALRVLGWRDALRWSRDWLRFSRTTFFARTTGRILPQVIDRIDQISPAGGLFLRAHMAEWQAMGWFDPSTPSKGTL